MGLRLQETEFGRNCEIQSNVQGEDEGALLEDHVSWPPKRLILHWGHRQRRKSGCSGCTSSKYIG